MTLTELKYIVAVAKERHFGRAAKTCHVSQPTLSVGIKKLEDELGLALFERGTNDVTPTAVGELIIAQATKILEEAQVIKEIAIQSGDPLAHPLRLGAIFTIGPYVLPRILPILRKTAPNMQLIIKESYTASLREDLKQGKLDAIIISLPFSEPGVVTLPLYDEPFKLAMPADHAWANKSSIDVTSIGDETVLLLGAGHCFRDQVLKFCPQLSKTQTATGMQQTLEGSSLETIRYMVASGVGMTILPSSACLPTREENAMLMFKSFTAPQPSRKVALAWRASFPRPQAIEMVKRAILSANIADTTPVN